MPKEIKENDVPTAEEEVHELPKHISLLPIVHGTGMMEGYSVTLIASVPNIVKSRIRDAANAGDMDKYHNCVMEWVHSWDGFNDYETNQPLKHPYKHGSYFDRLCSHEWNWVEAMVTEAMSKAGVPPNVLERRGGTAQIVG